MKTTKAEISKIFAELRKYGFLVYNFNQKTKFGRGLVGFVDHLIIGKNCIWFIEVKVGNDTIKPNQQKIYDCVDQIGRRNNWVVDARIITSPDEIKIAKNLRDKILEIG